MSYNDKTKQYVYDYKAKKIKRIPLDVQVSEFDLIKAAADASGESVNGFIKAAIKQRMERDGFSDPAAGTQPLGDVPGPGRG